MDFVIGIILVLIIIFIMINFLTISISDTNYNKCIGNNLNFLFSSTNNTLKNNNLRNNTPSPIIANSPLALNKKMNLDEQAYDYKQNFFI